MGALRVWAGEGGLRIEPNAAAETWGRAHAVGDADWRALAQRCLGAEADDVELPMQLAPPLSSAQASVTQALLLACRRIGLPDGALIWLTPRPAADDSLRLLVDQLELAQEFGRMGLFVRDLASGRGQWDRHVHRIFGLDPRDGTPDFNDALLRCVHPGDLEALLHHHRRAMSLQGRGGVRFRIRRPDGELRHIHSLHEIRPGLGGGPGRMVGVLIDDTEVVQRIAAEQEANAVLDRALRLAGISVWRIDLLTQRIHFNAVGFHVMGMDANATDIPVQAMRDTIHPDDLAAVLRGAEEAATSERVVDVVARFRHTDGSWRTLLTRRVADRNAQGEVVALAGISLDIGAQLAERARAEALLQDKQRAEQASRDKSIFMARMSHELRTPMNAVLGFTQLLEDDTSEPPSERQRGHLQRIRQAGTRLMALIDDVLDLARLDAEVPSTAGTPVPVAEVLREVADAVAALAARHGQRLQSGALPPAVFVQADGARLAQAIGQLAAHAIRRRDRPGNVEIGATLQATAAGEQVVFSVRGDGDGDGPGAGPALFEPLGWPADEGVDEGHGLALGQARRAVEAMGGIVEAECEPGAGNVFRVRLPVEAVSARIGPPALRVAGDRSPGLVVVCVEDNPVNMLLVRELLALRPGVRFSGAVDGRSGIAAALSERPDVVLLDLQLPDIGGVDVMRCLRAEPALAGCVFVALSANAMPADIQAARDAGFDDYWTKPINFELFLAGIDRLAALRA